MALTAALRMRSGVGRSGSPKPRLILPGRARSNTWRITLFSIPCKRFGGVNFMGRTVGAALRGRPWFGQRVQESTASKSANMIKTTGGHGGPPLQYVRWPPVVPWRQARSSAQIILEAHGGVGLFVAILNDDGCIERETPRASTLIRHRPRTGNNNRAHRNLEWTIRR